jgi:hypothetical protein
MLRGMIFEHNVQQEYSFCQVCLAKVVHYPVCFAY